VNLAKIVRLRNRYEAILSSILRLGIRLGVFVLSDAKTAALAMIPMLTGVAQWYRPGRRMTREQVIDRYTALCMAMVGASPGALRCSISAIFTGRRPGIHEAGGNSRREVSAGGRKAGGGRNHAWPWLEPADSPRA